MKDSHANSFLDGVKKSGTLRKVGSTFQAGGTGAKVRE